MLEGKRAGEAISPVAGGPPAEPPGYGPRVLIIRTPPSAEAVWAEQGWPTVVPTDSDHRERPELFGWAMRTITPAVRSADWPAVEDLVDEGNVWLSRIRGANYSAPDAAVQPFLSITDTLWPEVQRAVGARDPDRLTYAARLLSKLCGVADVVGRRPVGAVPAYVPLAERPYLTAAGPSRPGPAGQFLADLAAILSNQRGHLVDAADDRRPPVDKQPDAMGWRSATDPQGPPLGSLDNEAGTLRLRAKTVAQLLQESRGPAEDSEIETRLGEALAGAWLIDTTLVVDPDQFRRVAGVIDTWWDGGDSELIWRLPEIALGDAGSRGTSRRW